MAEAPETEGLREFATRIGCKPGYVTELKAAGRLVLTEDGRRVRVAESLALIRDTRDPAKAGVRARHAATRAAEAGDGVASPPAGDTGADDAPLADDNPHSLRRAKALADKEEALARKALREEQIEMGQLLPRDQVVVFVAEAVTQLRKRLELMPAAVVPKLGVADPARAIAIFKQDIEVELEQLARKFGAIGKVDG